MPRNDDPYDTLFEPDPGADPVVIDARLTEIARREQTVVVTSYFDELPILSRSPVTMLREGKIEIAPREIHLNVLDRQHRCFVTLPDGASLLADVTAVNLEQRFAVLARFRFVRILAALREALRIGVHHRVDCEAEIDGARSVATLHDVSLGGACVTTTRPGLPPGTPLQLRVWLRAGPGRTLVGFTLRATIARVDLELPPGSYGLRFELDPATEGELAHFINRLQLELIRQLRGD